jgi:hypothetical protein
MDVLLLWNFSPGRAVEAQVRRRFHSQVHFSPSSSSKEFFLVVSFSYSSFALSEESVALALQCCLGGHAAGFHVILLSDKCFRFSVASSKVGHFIYSLRERSWPDFHCRFSLFRGDPYALCYLDDIKGKSPGLDSSWTAVGKKGHGDHAFRASIPGPSHRSLAIKTCSDFLKPNDPSMPYGDFSSELAKFGFSLPLVSKEIGQDFDDVNGDASVNFSSFDPSPAAVSPAPEIAPLAVNSLSGNRPHLGR